MLETGTLQKKLKFPKKKNKTSRIWSEKAETTQRELQDFPTSNGWVPHVTTISFVLHISGLRDRVARQIFFLNNHPGPLKV